MTKMTCKNGHTNLLEDMDKLGMDYVCPECGVVMRVHQ